MLQLCLLHEEAILVLTGVVTIQKVIGEVLVLREVREENGIITSEYKSLDR